MADFDKIQEQIDAVRSAADEAERNLGEIENKPNQQAIDYLRGDAYELEQRTNRLTQNLRNVADETEERLQDEAEAETKALPPSSATP